MIAPWSWKTRFCPWSIIHTLNVIVAIKCVEDSYKNKLSICNLAERPHLKMKRINKKLSGQETLKTFFLFLLNSETETAKNIRENWWFLHSRTNKMAFVIFIHITKGHSLYQISSKMLPGSKVITLVGKKKKRGGLAGIRTHDLPLRSLMC